MLIRPVQTTDIAPLLAMLRSSGQFDEAGLAHINATLSDYFSGRAEQLWFSADQQGLAGVAYAAPEVMADNVWNLLLLWICPSHQRQGVGEALLARIEQELRALNARLLLVETSSLPEFGPARAFYDKQGFTHEARIRDFYLPNEDKVIYTKMLRPTAIL